LITGIFLGQLVQYVLNTSMIMTEQRISFNENFFPAVKPR